MMKNQVYIFLLLFKLIISYLNSIHFNITFLDESEVEVLGPTIVKTKKQKRKLEDINGTQKSELHEFIL